MTAISISTHVLDTAAGRPVPGVPVTLARYVRAEKDPFAAGVWFDIAAGTTDADGRIADLSMTDTELAAGRYRVHFDLAGAPTVERTWYPEVAIVVDLEPGTGHVHVPLLLAPYGYTTYRGS